MAEKIVLETEIKTGNSSNSVKSVKAELRELKTEMAGLDNSSQEFVKMAQRAGQLEDAIGDANAAVKAFNPEAKLQAVVGVVGGVANGFAAAQGAMALFGGESEELEKLMAKTQGAIALATGINGLMGMKDSFINLGNVIKINVVGAFTTLKGALIATGIGALVIAIGVAINEIIKYNEAIDDEANAQEKLNDELKKTEDLMAGVAAASEKKRNAKQGGLDQLKRELELLQAQGASEKTLFEKRQEIASKELQNLKIRKYSGLEVTKEIADKENEILVNKAAYETKVREEAEKKAKEAAEKKKKVDKGNADYAKEFDKRMKILADEEWQKEIDAMDYQATVKTSLSENEANKLLSTRKLTNEELAGMAFMSYSEQVEYLKKLAEADKKLEEEKKQAKIDTLKTVGEALGGFAELAGKETAAGKALAIAQATIDTYVSAGTAYAAAAKIDPFVLAPLAAAGAIAAGIARVKAIVSVKVPGGSGGNNIPNPSSAGSVPQFNPAVAQQVQGGGDVQLGMKPQKVYVVESDIRGTMNKVDVIEANATIG
jgi:hypothetical protein